MILRPTFLDHWRVVLLQQLLEDPLAPQYVIRLWSHCEVQRQVVFPGLPDVALNGICRWSGEPRFLIDALIQVGFLDALEGGGFSVPKFEEYNRQLCTSWANGSRGGRRSKATRTHGEPDPLNLVVNQNPGGTRGEPDRNPGGTRAEPGANPGRTRGEPGAPLEESRVEKRREEKKRQETGVCFPPSGSDDLVPLPPAGQDSPPAGHSWPVTASGDDSGPTTPPATFAAFMAAFPARGRRAPKDAEKAWHRAIQDVEPRVICLAASRYAASPRGRSEYVKSAAAWLDGGCYLEEPEAWELPTVAVRVYGNGGQSLEDRIKAWEEKREQ